MKSIDLHDFYIEHLQEALSLDLSDYPAINDVLEKQIRKMKEADCKSEILEVKTFSENAVKELKNKIRLHLRNGMNATYKNHTPPYLWDIRLLYEYRGVLDLIVD